VRRRRRRLQRRQPLNVNLGVRRTSLRLNRRRETMVHRKVVVPVNRRGATTGSRHAGSSSRQQDVSTSGLHHQHRRHVRRRRRRLRTRTVGQRNPAHVLGSVHEVDGTDVTCADNLIAIVRSIHLSSVTTTNYVHHVQHLLRRHEDFDRALAGSVVARVATVISTWMRHVMNHHRRHRVRHRRVHRLRHQQLSRRETIPGVRDRAPGLRQSKLARSRIR